MTQHRYLFVTQIRRPGGQGRQEWPLWGGGDGKLLVLFCTGGQVSVIGEGPARATPSGWRVAVVCGRFMARQTKRDERFSRVNELVGALVRESPRIWVHIGEHVSSSRQEFRDGLLRASTDEAANYLKDALPYNLGLAGQPQVMMDVQAEVERFRGLVGRTVATGAIEEGVLDGAMTRLDAPWNRLRADWQLKALRPLFALYTDMAGLLKAQGDASPQFDAYLKEVQAAYSDDSSSWLAEAKAELGDEHWRSLGVERTLPTLRTAGSFGATQVEEAGRFIKAYESLLASLRAAAAPAPQNTK